MVLSYARVVRTYFTSEHATVKPEVPRDVDQFDIRGNLLAQGDMYEVTGDKRRGGHSDLLAVAEHDNVRGEHTPDRGHHSGRGEVLPRVEDCLQHDDDEEHDRERKVGRLRGRFTQWFPARVRVPQQPK
jgi:hypothetical protein